MVVDAVTTRFDLNTFLGMPEEDRVREVRALVEAAQ